MRERKGITVEQITELGQRSSWKQTSKRGLQFFLDNAQTFDFFGHLFLGKSDPTESIYGMVEDAYKREIGAMINERPPLLDMIVDALARSVRFQYACGLEKIGLIDFPAKEINGLIKEAILKHLNLIKALENDWVLEFLARPSYYGIIGGRQRLIFPSRKSLIISGRETEELFSTKIFLRRKGVFQRIDTEETGKTLQELNRFLGDTYKNSIPENKTPIVASFLEAFYMTTLDFEKDFASITDKLHFGHRPINLHAEVFTGSVVCGNCLKKFLVEGETVSLVIEEDGMDEYAKNCWQPTGMRDKYEPQQFIIPVIPLG